MLERSATAPLQRVRFASVDQGETEEFIRQMYVGNRTTFLDVPAGATGFRVTAVVSEQLSADRVRSEVDYVAASAPWDHFCFMTMYGGRIRMRHGSEEMTVGAGEHAFYPVGADLEVQLDRVDCRTVRLPIRRLRVTADEIAGARAKGFRFVGNTPVSLAMARRWTR